MLEEREIKYFVDAEPSSDNESLSFSTYIKAVDYVMACIKSDIMESIIDPDDPISEAEFSGILRNRITKVLKTTKYEEVRVGTELFQELEDSAKFSEMLDKLV